MDSPVESIQRAILYQKSQVASTFQGQGSFSAFCGLIRGGVDQERQLQVVDGACPHYADISKAKPSSWHLNTLAVIRNVFGILGSCSILRELKVEVSKQGGLRRRDIRWTPEMTSVPSYLELVEQLRALCYCAVYLSLYRCLFRQGGDLLALSLKHLSKIQNGCCVCLYEFARSCLCGTIGRAQGLVISNKSTSIVGPFYEGRESIFRLNCPHKMAMICSYMSGQHPRTLSSPFLRVKSLYSIKGCSSRP
jgi:hypothetical protein